MKILLPLLLCLTFASQLPAASSLTSERELESRHASDRIRIDSWRRFHTTLVRELERLILRSDSAPLSEAEQTRAHELFSGIVDLQLALDVVDQQWRAVPAMRAALVDRSTATAYEAWLARVTGAMSLVEITRSRDSIRELLNQPLPELGLGAGTLTRVQQMVETATTANQFMAFDSSYREAVTAGTIPPSPSVDEDAARLRRWMSERGVQTSAENASRLLVGGASPAAVITGSRSPWFGDAGRVRRTRPLITPVWVSRVAQMLQPGDIILLRDEWEPAGAGLSSYWGNAAIWVGTPAERRHHFRDPATLAAFRSEGAEDLDALIRGRTPTAYGASLAHQAEPLRLITGTPFGITFETDYRLQADSIAVLRLRRAPLDRARVVARAFELSGRAFDPTGDLTESSAIGSAELVLRSLGEDAPRLTRSRAAVDDLVQWFDSFTGDANPTFDLIVYLEGDELSRNVTASTPDVFRASWRRPAWQTWISASTQRGRR